VASAQCHDDWWDSVKVKKFIDYIRSNYQVDTLRVYLTGLSMGGYATYDQLVNYGSNSHLAAAVPIAGTAALSESNIRRASEVPFWAFHGKEDQNVSSDFSKKIVSEIHTKYPTAEARLTMFSAIGHNCWTITYNGSGMGQEDPAYDQFSPDLYTWMLKHSRRK
jgi:predicted peptidase